MNGQSLTEFHSADVVSEDSVEVTTIKKSLTLTNYHREVDLLNLRYRVLAYV